MDTTVIRNQLHQYLEVAEDKKVKAIYTMMEAEVIESIFEYTDELKKELQQRNAVYKNGTAKIVAAEESENRIQAILNKLHEK